MGSLFNFTEPNKLSLNLMNLIYKFNFYLTKDVEFIYTNLYSEELSLLHRGMSLK